MNHTTREDKNKGSRAKLSEVVQAGADLGFWKLVKVRQQDEGDSWRFVLVITPAGHTFSLSAGGWSREGSITAAVEGLKGPHGLSVSPRDVIRYEETAVEASASYTRPAATIAKDLNKRVCADPVAMDYAQRLIDRLAKLEADRASLRGHMATLADLGYNFRDTPEQETHSAKGWKPNGTPWDLQVYASGRVDFKESVNVASFAAVAAVLAGAKADA